MWIILTFAAVFLWSLVNICDSYLVEKNKKIGHPIGSLVIFSSVFAFVVALLIFTFTGNELILSLTKTSLLIIAGFCNLLWIIFYLYALTEDDVSSIIPWFLSVPLFGYILGYFILGEALSILQIIGGLIVITGGIVLSLKRNSIKEKRGYHVKWKPIIFMLIASLLISMWAILFKFVARDVGFWMSSFWEHIGLGIAGVVVFVTISSYRIGFLTMLKKSGKRILFINTFSEIGTIVGNLLANYALLLVPVTLVFILGATQPAVVFVLGIVCTLFFPKILTEDISKKTLMHKGISIAIMSFGGLLLLI